MTGPLIAKGTEIRCPNPECYHYLKSITKSTRDIYSGDCISAKDWEGMVMCSRMACPKCGRYYIRDQGPLNPDPQMLFTSRGWIAV